MSPLDPEINSDKDIENGVAVTGDPEYGKGAVILLI